jgi:hypothetical protein
MRELDWIVSLLVDLHSFCEQNGLSVLSDRLADAIEEAAPMIRGGVPETESARHAEPAGRSPRRFLTMGEPDHPMAFGRLSLAYDSAIGTQQ